ncbi:MAG: carboxypeptidase regulatory-like domain-containing protein, partial [Acidobacteriota bacterium]
MMLNRTVWLSGAVWLFLTTSVLPTAAQITTGTITGIVVDAQGGVVPGASVAVTSETQGTKTAPVITTSAGGYVVPSLQADRYTIEVSMPGFKTVTRSGVRVSGGDRIAVEALVLEVGIASETVTVTAEPALLQAASGERSAVIDITQLESLPIGSHDFQQFVAMTPGVNGLNRVGGGGQDNYMIDGVSAMDTGNNSLMGGLNLPVDAVAEIKVLTSGYPAEYGRSSGLQVSAVTRSGTNRFRWSVFSYQRESPAPTASWADTENGFPRVVSQQLDVGYTLGGPVGRPGRKNRLFFFYTHEYRPRRAGNFVNVVRLPTALERRGDFSQTRDANGLVYNLIYDASSGLPRSACSAEDSSACFQDGGVVGHIPANRLYGPGMALLNQYPLPNVEAAPGRAFNYAGVTPIQVTLSHTPVIRLDYQASSRLRLTGKWAGQTSLVAPTFGTLPGFDDTLQRFPLSVNASVTAAYSIGPTTFLEATIGANQNRLGAPPVTPFSNRNNVVCPGELAAMVPRCTLGGIALLFPDAGVIDPRYYEYGALQDVGAPFFQDGRSVLPPQLAWSAPGTASRVATGNCTAAACA